ncbi:NAD(P)-dependent dehydrogenase, short-chain alcohol dehydrogenase family [Poseidonocella pacifica]|uniref:NAD(P)-dependent dehydrogenase, short-chain alcohol dehydrogenase family n=1 Tax=Poseidonocella pacifica TaxID=871651 RepID=A0A1I0W8Z7_9RHOB|nr:SDR family oxidoreductase [Poseidonocella pacifica]SFA84768.1 NAD(P)-dependent dehydrogenase, short-chain alcohol dehydrogenase family [Poseidonocella pacifica]
MADMTFGPRGWTPERLTPLSGKTYVITGANAGAGFQAARILLTRGAKVVMLNRSAERSTAAIKDLKQEFGAQADVSFIRMDLSDLSSVRAATQEVLNTVPRIDGLICNAAIAQVPSRQLTVDGFESQLGTNHYGHFVLCGMLFDRIEASQGRIVVVASLGYKMGLRTIKFDDINWKQDYGANTAYSQSKLAQMMFAYELQDRVNAAGREVEVYVCHPGSSATSLISTSGGLMTRFTWWLMTKTPMVQTAEQGAYPEVMCATENGLDQRALYGPTGRMEFVGPVGRGTLESHAFDKPVMARLWDMSEQATGFTWSV